MHEKRTRKVWLVGAHSTGKSTLARWIQSEYQIPLIPETARTLIGELGKTLDQIRLDAETSDAFQWQIFERQWHAESGREMFVSDRGCDHIAYAAEHSHAAATIMRDMRFRDYMEAMRNGIVFFVRPHKDLIIADGVRAGLDWDSVVRIDAMVKFVLKAFDIPFIAISTRAMDERISTIRGVMGKPSEWME